MPTTRFVQIPVDLIGGLARMRLAGRQAAVCAALLANLYRWPEVRDRLSASYLATATGRSRANVRGALQELVALGVIAIGATRRGSRPGRIEFLPVAAWTWPANVAPPACQLPGPPGLPGSDPAPCQVPGPPACPEPGTPGRHNLKERELRKLATSPAPGANLEQIQRDELQLLEGLPPSDFRSARILKVRRQIADTGEATG